MTAPYLTETEIADICDGLTQPAAQCRYLLDLGLLVRKKPNGKPLIARSNWEVVMGGRAPGIATVTETRHTDAPDELGLVLHFNKDRVKPTHGTSPKKQSSRTT